MRTFMGPLGLVAFTTVAALVGCSAAPAADNNRGEAGGDGDGDGTGLNGDDTGLSTGYYSGDGDGAYDYTSGYPNEEEDPAQGGAGGAPSDSFDAVGTNPFVEVDHDPLSTFAADVDSASYDLFRNRTGYGQTIDPRSVRLEDFVNHFDYDYAPPEEDAQQPFSVHLSAAPHLAQRDTRLLRVGIQGKVVTDIPPANLVFLVDASGSMSGEMGKVKSLLSTAVEQLQPDDMVSIVTYASNPSTLLRATSVSDKQTILGAIASLESGGSTNGEGGINAAYNEAQRGFKEDGINHIFLCTDGDFNVGVSSTDELEDLVEAKRKTGVTFTALGFGGSNFNDAMMERISNIGNGTYSYIGSEQDADAYAQDRLLQAMVYIAQDVKIQVEFNPEYIYAYRLLGYENRAIADDDFRDDVIDAGEIGSGHRVTALYELAFTEADLPTVSGEFPLDQGGTFNGNPEIAAEDFVKVKIRYKNPGAAESDPAYEIAESLSPGDVATDMQSADSDLQYAAAVAAYAEILKESPFADPGALDAIEAVLEAQKGLDDERAEFLSLFKGAR